MHWIPDILGFFLIKYFIALQKFLKHGINKQQFKYY